VTIIETLRLVLVQQIGEGEPCALASIAPDLSMPLFHLAAPLFASLAFGLPALGIQLSSVLAP
jgi:hypothetical protein